MEFVVSVTAIVAINTVLLVFQMGQLRIWMSMSRDGLMPKNLQKFTQNIKHQVSLLLLQELLLVYRFLFTDKTFILDFTSIDLFRICIGGWRNFIDATKEKLKADFLALHQC